VLFYGFLLLAGTGIFFLKKKLHEVTGPSWHTENMTYLPKGDRLKDAFLGFETTVAHYLWIRTILYVGEHVTSDREYVWLIDMIDNITRLCPWFYPAYEFAGLMIPDICGNPEAARILLERGMTHLGPKRWSLPFYMGMVYLKYYNDRRTAAEYVARAAMADSPHKAKLASMAHSFYTQAGIPDMDIQVLLFSYETSDNPEVRRHLAEKIKAYRSDAATR
jgi:hypothetical protein